MKRTHTIEQLEQEIEEVKARLAELGRVHPGSISEQYHACGKKACRCHDSVNPKKHGPYNKLNYAYRGKSSCRFVRKEHVAELEQRLSNYKSMRKLVDRWIELSIQAGAVEFFSKE